MAARSTTAAATLGDCVVESTGADGFQSWYGSEIAIGSELCQDWEAYGEFWAVGIAGVRPTWST